MSMDLVGKMLALISAIFWALAVILFKRAGNQIRPLALNFYKSAVTAVLIIPILLFAHIPLIPAQLEPKHLLAALLSGVIGIALADTLFFFCLNLLGASLTAIIDCMYIPCVMVCSWLVLGEVPHLTQIGGALLVIAAILLAALQKDEAPTRDEAPHRDKAPVPLPKLIFGLIVGTSAMGLMAISIVLMRPVLHRAPIFWVTEVRLLAAMVALSFFLIIHNDSWAMLKPLGHKNAWRTAFPGTILGNLLAMSCWVAAFKFTTVNAAAVLNQTNTVFIVVLASLLLKEPFTKRRLVATILAVIGSAFVLAT